MGEAASANRDDIIMIRGTPAVDATGDLCPGNVGGMKVALAFRQNFAATQSAVAMKAIGLTNTGYAMPKAGSVVGMSAYFAAALSSADKAVTFQIFKNTTGGMTVVTAPSGQTSYKTANKDTYAFAAGDKIFVKMTNSTIASAGLNAQALVIVEF